MFPLGVLLLLLLKVLAICVNLSTGRIGTVVTVPTTEVHQVVVL